MNELQIIYQDSYLVAVNKPSGLLVHRSDLDPFETEFALQKLRNQLGSKVFPLHRIDKPTSGVLLFALTSDIAREVTEEFLRKEFKKVYFAIVRGWIPDEVVVDRGIRHDKEKERRSALTHFSKLASIEIPYPVGPFDTARYSLIKAVPETGRRHQIRKHLNHISYPIVGDTWYGDRDHNRFFANTFEISQMLLHAGQVSFTHPVSRLPLKITANLPAHWEKALRILNFSLDIQVI